MRRTTQGGPHLAAGGCLSPLGGTTRPPPPVSPVNARPPIAMVRLARRGIVHEAAPSRSAGAESVSRAHPVRRRLAALVSLLLVAVLVIAGCGGASGPPDPYQLLGESSKVTWDPIQINVGLKFKIAGESVNL